MKIDHNMVSRAAKNPLLYSKAVVRRLSGAFASALDTRQRLNDLSKIPPHRRSPSSHILQFYSSNDNIGNYTPILGQQEMLEMPTDTWCVHRRPIDFDFINRNYSGIIVGGAGLLDPVFGGFWKELDELAKLPTIIWGIGGCWPKDRKMASDTLKLIKKSADRSDLVNVRDQLTASYFNFSSPSIAPCPTITWLSQFRGNKKPKNQTLVAHHVDLVNSTQMHQIESSVRSTDCKTVVTDNIQTKRASISKIVSESYLPSNLVVTTRLHGAIIAFGLGIDYIAISHDDKIKAFQEEWGGGHLSSIEELAEALKRNPTPRDPSIHDNLIRDFGKRARDWAKTLTPPTLR